MALRNFAAQIHFPGWPALCRRLTGRIPLRHLPPHQVQSWDYCVAPAQAVVWPPFRCWGPTAPPFRISLQPVYPALGVLAAPALVAMGPDGWLLDAEGRWIAQTSWFAWAPERRPARQFTPPIRPLAGRAALLCSDWAATNYFHLLLDSFSRLGLLRAAGIALDSIDTFLIPEPLSAAIEALWDLAGVPAAKRLALTPGLAVAPEILLAPSFPGQVCAPHPLALAYLRELVSCGNQVRRLFIPRRAQNRLLHNEAQLWSRLQTLGFEIFDPSTQPQQHLAFAQASVIVGVHGAALANLAFCQPGTRVVEILPTDHCFPFFYALSAAAGLDYRCVLALSDTQRPPDDIGPSLASCTVDTDLVLEALHAA